MTRESEQALIDFCVQQQSQFDAAEWQQFHHPSRDEFLAAVLFLAGVGWYGHNQELVNIANQIELNSSGQLSKIALRSGFDLSRFSTQLRRKLHHESIVRAS